MSIGNADQKAFWETFATLWVGKQEDLDALMAPVLAGVLDRAALKPEQRVLDIGCGTGTSSVLAAHAVGADGHVTGADISEPMLARARATTGDIAQLSFETTDVAEHSFAPGSYDQVISRFGVMFFADPVAAFSNVLKAMRPGAQLTMACWSHLDKNPWFQVPMYAAKSQLGAPPPVDPDAPGPLAFRNTAKVVRILEQSGFQTISAETETLLLTPIGDMNRVAAHAASIGPAARAIEYFDATAADFDTIVARVAAGFADFETPNGVRVPAAINFFTATAPNC